MTYKLILLPFAALLVILSTCTIDTGLAPTQSGITGVVHFQNGWPKTTGEVMVVASTKFPPTSLEEIIMSEPLPTFVDSASFVIWTNPQTFQAVGVVWKEKDQPWDVTNIIGIYFPTSDHFSPGVVTIPDRNTLVDSISIDANLANARLRVDSAIQGTLRVKGDWPSGAESVLVVASKTILPTSLLDVVFGSPIEAGFDSTAYSLSLQPGTYRLVGALVTETGKSIGIESIKGLYRKNPGDFLPGSIVVPTDTTVATNIDITLDFESGLLP